MKSDPNAALSSRPFPTTWDPNGPDIERGHFVRALLVAVLVLVSATQPATASQPSGNASALLAGFAREKITPPLGTRMMGFASRDYKQGCQAIHDDLYVRALFLQHGEERFLILAYDLCFLGREEADRFKGALGRDFDLAPRQILLNTSHNHAGAMVGTWYWAGVFPPNRPYLSQLLDATLTAACEAHDNMREAKMSVQVGMTKLPMSRRKPDGKGDIAFVPNPGGKIYDRLPVCLIQDKSNKPICLMFSLSAHPSMVFSWDISADYPGAACRLLDEHLGTTAAMFLQGCGGDANTSVMGEGATQWRKADWEEVEKAGHQVASEVVRALDKGLKPVKPILRSAITEMHLPLQKIPPRGEFEDVVNQAKPEARESNMRCQWAAHQLEKLDRGEKLPTDVAITLQVLHVGDGVNLVGMEGEPVNTWGYLIEDFCGAGVTFPLGYCNGQGMYLPVSKMLPEGGYEVVSYWEYGLPSPLAPGMEKVVVENLQRLAGRVGGLR